MAKPIPQYDLETWLSLPAWRRKKQTVRMLKAVCDECGYTVRLTLRWAKKGAPHCPQHGAMTVEGIRK